MAPRPYKIEGSPYWYGRIQIAGQDRKFCLDTTSKGLAEERLRKRVDEAKAGRWGDGATSYADAVEAFTDKHLPRLRASTRRRYIDSLLHLSADFEKLSLAQIGTKQLSLFEDRRRDQEVTEATIIRDLRVLSKLYEFCDAREMWTGRNPAKSYLKRAREDGSLTDSRPRTRYLSHEEERLILAEVESHRMLHAGIILGLDTGLRAEELFGLEWTHVDLERREITITAKRAKTAVERRVPIKRRSLDLLMSLPRSKHSRSILWHDDGQRYWDMYHQLVKAADVHGILDVRWHDLRRTCGCRLLQDDKLPMEQVSLWLGHSSVTVTERSYAFLRIEHLHASLKLVEERQSKDLTTDKFRLLKAEGHQAENSGGFIEGKVVK